MTITPTRALLLAALQIVAARAAITPSSLELLHCRAATTTPLFRMGFEFSEGMPSGSNGSARVTVNNQAIDALDVRFSGDKLLVMTAAPYLDVASMQGRTLDFDVAWIAPGGRTVRSKLIARWIAGEMATVYNDACSADESRKAPTTRSTTPLWRAVLVFLGLAIIWLIAAFAVPRLVWPPEDEAIRPLRRGSP